MGAFLPDDSWTLHHHGVAEADEFKTWIYRNMVVEPILTGLLTNLFSEIYNHAEYAIAGQAFSLMLDRHYDFSPSQREQALMYIQAHVDDDTEVNHFNVMVKAIDLYTQTTDEHFDEAAAIELFTNYLHGIGAVMNRLTETWS